MDKFKVICKLERDKWYTYPIGTKVVATRKWFGLMKTTTIVQDPKKSNAAPDKEEICIVIDTIQKNGMDCYKLAGYGDNYYHSIYFVRLDEFTETQKEIAEKAQPVLN